MRRIPSISLCRLSFCIMFVQNILGFFGLFTAIIPLLSHPLLLSKRTFCIPIVRRRSRIKYFLPILAIALVTASCTQNGGSEYLESPPAPEEHFILDSKLSDLMVVDGVGSGAVNIRFGIQDPTSRIITLTYTLAEITKSDTSLIASKTLYENRMQTDAIQTFTIPFDYLAKGKYTIELQALTEINEHGERWGALRITVLTVSGGKITIDNEYNVRE